MDKIDRLGEIINKSNNIVFFGGAGVSTLSGIRDFRGKNGLYKDKYEHSAEYYLSIDCFNNEPDIFYKFYKDNMNTLDKKPNIVHEYLVKLEKEGKLKAVITQNIDGLHQRAGSKNVLEVHGTTYKNKCIKCNKEYNAEYVFNSKGIPICVCGGIIKPCVTLYGEALPDDFIKAIDYIKNADTLIVVGTSLTVEPASSLIRYFNGSNLVIINMDKTNYDSIAKLVINDDIGIVIEKLSK